MDKREVWAECTSPHRVGKVFFHGRADHIELEGCCREVDEKQVKRAAGMLALQGKKNNVRVYGCYANGTPCPRCLREEGKGLWVTTSEPPRPLEELFPSTQDSGKPPSGSKDGSAVPRSPYTSPKKKGRMRKAQRNSKSGLKV